MFSFYTYMIAYTLFAEDNDGSRDRGMGDR